MLTLGWSDGISFLPISCALLASSKEKNRLVPLRTDLDRRTNGAKRRREGIGYAEALAFLLTLFEQALSTIVGISKELISSLVERFLEELPPVYRARLLLSGKMQPISC